MRRDGGGARPRILVVDDDQAIRELIADALVALAYEVVFATTADQALAIVRSTSRPDVVLLDIEMPGGMNGDQIVAEIVGRGSTVIVISGAVNDAIRARLLEAGALDVMPKPFSLPRLRARIAEAVMAR